MNPRAVASVAYKELLHIWRDRRILVLLLLLPPLFTLMFGHAFEATARTHVPALLYDADASEVSRRFVDVIGTNQTFQWRQAASAPAETPDLLGENVRAALVVPAGWGRSLRAGDPLPLRVVLDGADSNTATELEGAVQAALGDFQLRERQYMIDDLPEEVFELGKKLPVEVRKQFVSSMTPWTLKSQVLYNPNLRFIEFVMPGIIGLILQLLTVTLTACTIVRERESGTYSQLMVTPLRRLEIVVGKTLPYLGISILIIVGIIALAGWHFAVVFREPFSLALICFLFLLCSLGLGLVISAICQTQTQAIQASVFFLLPVFVLSGAFASLENLPDSIRPISELFPLTHFCRAFRLAYLYGAPFSRLAGDLAVLSLGVVLTFGGATFLMRRVRD